MKKDLVYKVSDKIQKRVRDAYSGADLYVFRYEYKKDGSWELRNSKPCAHCTEIIKMSGIRYVYYSEKEGFSDDLSITRIVKIHSKYLQTDHFTYGRRFSRKEK
jgi:tRNA(Arg) A34 adenosine deaminase TadA